MRNVTFNVVGERVLCFHGPLMYEAKVKFCSNLLFTLFFQRYASLNLKVHVRSLTYLCATCSSLYISGSEIRNERQGYAVLNSLQWLE